MFEPIQIKTIRRRQMLPTVSPFIAMFLKSFLLGPCGKGFVSAELNGPVMVWTNQGKLLVRTQSFLSEDRLVFAVGFTPIPSLGSYSPTVLRNVLRLILQFFPIFRSI